MGAAAPEDDGEAADAYVVYAKRWAILAIFSLGSALNGMMFFTYAPISSFASEYYDAPTSAVNGFAISFMVLYLPGSVLSSFLIQKKGLRSCMVAGAVLNAAGAALRYGACFLPASHYVRFAVALLGQSLAGLAQPIFTNAPATVAGRWFGLAEREAATTIATLVNPLGNAAGTVVPSILVTATKNAAGDVVETHGMALLMAVQLGVAALFLVVVVVSFESQPPTPPTRSALQRCNAGAGTTAAAVPAFSSAPAPGVDAPAAVAARARTASGTYQPLMDEPEPEAGPYSAGGGTVVVAAAEIGLWASLWSDFRTLARNREYVRLATGFGLGVALFQGFLAVIEQLVKPAGYTPGNAGMFGGVLIGTGLVGAALAAVVLDKTYALREALKVGITFALVSVVLFCASMRPGQLGLLTAAFGVMGFFLMPLLPICISNCAEVTFPLPEEHGVGVMIITSQYLGAVFTVLFHYLIHLRPHYENVYPPVNIFIVSVVLLATIIVMPYSGEYKRWNHDHGVASDSDPLLSPAAERHSPSGIQVHPVL